MFVFINFLFSASWLSTGKIVRLLTPTVIWSVRPMKQKMLTISYFAMSQNVPLWIKETYNICET